MDLTPDEIESGAIVFGLLIGFLLVILIARWVSQHREKSDSSDPPPHG